MSGTQKIRAGLYYLSLMIFLIGLPFILTYALGYKYNTRTMHFTRTGIIVLKTQPAGASIFLDGKLLPEKTPVTLSEILPGTYSFKIELPQYYSWVSEAKVEASKVLLFDKIILFPLRANIKQVNKGRISSFYFDNERNYIYQMDPDDQGIYRSNPDGSRLEFAAWGARIDPQPVNWRPSPDHKKLMYFNHHQIAIASLESDNQQVVPPDPFIIKYPNHQIREAFWHSDSFHLIVVTSKNIEIREARIEAAAVNLVDLNKDDPAVYYDLRTDTLYFLDRQKAEDGRYYDNLYKLELSNRYGQLFRELIRLAPAFEREASHLDEQEEKDK